jgi:hypothetical protein
MKVRLVIDRIVLEGNVLPAGEHAAFEDALRNAFAATMRGEVVARSLPQARNALREPMQLMLSRAVKGARLGGVIGASLARHMWNGATARPRDAVGRR